MAEKIDVLSSNNEINFWGNKVKIVEMQSEAGCSPQYINHIIYGERSGEKYLEQIFLILGMDEYHV